MLTYNDYYQYYSSQAGGAGIDRVFSGAPIQHGRGLGNILGSLLKFARPFLPGLARTGLGFASDLSQGIKPMQALRKRGAQAVEEVANVAAKRMRGRGAPTKTSQNKKGRGKCKKKSAVVHKRKKDQFDNSKSK